jgi:hypothetical protein
MSSLEVRQLPDLSKNSAAASQPVATTQALTAALPVAQEVLKPSNNTAVPPKDMTKRFVEEEKQIRNYKIRRAICIVAMVVGILLVVSAMIATTVITPGMLPVLGVAALFGAVVGGLHLKPATFLGGVGEWAILVPGMLASVATVVTLGLPAVAWFGGIIIASIGLFNIPQKMPEGMNNNITLIKH